jgi:hypothetical protein
MPFNYQWPMMQCGYGAKKKFEVNGAIINGL